MSVYLECQVVRLGPEHIHSLTVEMTTSQSSCSVDNYPAMHIVKKTSRSARRILSESTWRRVIHRRPDGSPWLRTDPSGCNFAPGNCAVPWQSPGWAQVSSAATAERWCLRYFRIRHHLSAVAVDDTWAHPDIYRCIHRHSKQYCSFIHCGLSY